jgi:hypothetical protein
VREALDVIGRRLKRFFSSLLTLLLPLESGKCNTSCLPFTPRASPAAVGNWEEEHIQLLRNKKRIKKILVGPRESGKLKLKES